MHHWQQKLWLLSVGVFFVVPTAVAETALESQITTLSRLEIIDRQLKCAQEALESNQTADVQAFCVPSKSRSEIYTRDLIDRARARVVTAEAVHVPVEAGNYTRDDKVRAVMDAYGNVEVEGDLSTMTEEELEPPRTGKILESMGVSSKPSPHAYMKPEPSLVQPPDPEVINDEAPPPSTTFVGQAVNLLHQRTPEGVFTRRVPWLETDLGLVTGYRQDDVKWSISGINNSPNIISELQWNDVEVWQIKGTAQLVFHDRFVLDGSAAYGSIFDGDNQDSDYIWSNRTGEYSRSNNKTRDDDTLDLSLGAGWRFYLGGSREFLLADHWWLTVLAGYSYHEQNLRMTDGYQSIPATGSFSGLNSTYKTQWDGPWTGFEFRAQRQKLSGFFRFEHHWVDYYGVGNWNLRSDFAHPKSFEQWADGTGVIYAFGAGYRLNERWRLNLVLDFQNWETDSGKNQFNLATGATQTLQDLNIAEWDSFSLSGGASLLF